MRTFNARLLLRGEGRRLVFAGERHCVCGGGGAQCEHCTGKAVVSASRQPAESLLAKVGAEFSPGKNVKFLEAALKI